MASRSAPHPTLGTNALDIFLPAGVNAISFIAVSWIRGLRTLYQLQSLFSVERDRYWQRKMTLGKKIRNRPQNDVRWIGKEYEAVAYLRIVFTRPEWSVRKSTAGIADVLTVIRSRFLSKTSWEPVYFGSCVTIIIH
jgi:hypothetical protein